MTPERLAEIKNVSRLLAAGAELHGADCKELHCTMNALVAEIAALEDRNRALEQQNRLFPCLNGAAIPWHVIEPHERQAKENHSQTLKGLAGRGGLAMCEMAAVLEDRPWHKMENDEARAVIERHLDKSQQKRITELESTVQAQADTLAKLREALTSGIVTIRSGEGAQIEYGFGIDLTNWLKWAEAALEATK